MAILPCPVKDGAPVEVASHKVIPIIARGRELKGADPSKLSYDKPWVRGEEKDLAFIPYYCRTNRRDQGGMRIWCFQG